MAKRRASKPAAPGDEETTETLEGEEPETEDTEEAEPEEEATEAPALPVGKLSKGPPDKDGRVAVTLADGSVRKVEPDEYDDLGKGKVRLRRA